MRATSSRWLDVAGIGRDREGHASRQVLDRGQAVGSRSCRCRRSGCRPADAVLDGSNPAAYAAIGALPSAEIRGRHKVRVTRIRFQQRRIRVRDRAGVSRPGRPGASTELWPFRACTRPGRARRTSEPRAVADPRPERDLRRGPPVRPCRRGPMPARGRPKHFAARRRNHRAASSTATQNRPSPRQPARKPPRIAALLRDRAATTRISSRRRFSAPPWPAASTTACCNWKSVSSGFAASNFGKFSGGLSGICLAIGGRSVRGGSACGPVPP